MITFKCKSGTTFISNGDLSGHIIIITPQNEEVTIPCQDMFDFIANKIRDGMVKRIENLDLWTLIMHHERE